MFEFFTNLKKNLNGTVTLGNTLTKILNYTYTHFKHFIFSNCCNCHQAYIAFRATLGTEESPEQKTNIMTMLT